MTEAPSNYRGFIVATFTPFDSKGQVNLDAIPAYAAHLKASGATGVFVNGTTGECMSLTSEERTVLAEAWLREREADFRVIVHVGDNCLPRAQELARHAEAHGADAISMMPPSFFKSPAAAVIDYCAAVAAEASMTPFYYYHFPLMTGTQFSLSSFLAVAREVIPTLRGAKFTDDDLMDMNQCAGADLEMLYARDRNLLAGLAMGTQAVVGFTYNFALPLYQTLWQQFEAGQLAQAQATQQKVIQLFEAIIPLGVIPAGKALMQQFGLELGGCRLPLRNIEMDTQRALGERLLEQKLMVR